MGDSYCNCCFVGGEHAPECDAYSPVVVNKAPQGQSAWQRALWAHSLDQQYTRALNEEWDDDRGLVERLRDVLGELPCRVPSWLPWGGHAWSRDASVEHGGGTVWCRRCLVVTRND